MAGGEPANEDAGTAVGGARGSWVPEEAAGGELALLEDRVACLLCAGRIPPPRWFQASGITDRERAPGVLECTTEPRVSFS